MGEAGWVPMFVFHVLRGEMSISASFHKHRDEVTHVSIPLYLNAVFPKWYLPFRLWMCGREADFMEGMLAVPSVLMHAADLSQVEDYIRDELEEYAAGLRTAAHRRPLHPLQLDVRDTSGDIQPCSLADVFRFVGVPRKVVVYAMIP
jgi:hypothetical protein